MGRKVTGFSILLRINLEMYSAPQNKAATMTAAIFCCSHSYTFTNLESIFLPILICKIGESSLCLGQSNTENLL